jgi:flavodoxin
VKFAFELWKFFIPVIFSRLKLKRMSKSLIVYYSRKGNNYVAGRIVNLSVGNTAVVAHKIQNMTGGDLFEIETVEQYPAGYNETTDIARAELRNHARPELASRPDDISRYDIIFLGYPNWWGTMPMALFTFLESFDFSGKTIFPFCTHEGSGLGKSEQDIKQLCPGAKTFKGLALRGSSVNQTSDEIKEWLKENQIIR